MKRFNFGIVCVFALFSITFFSCGGGGGPGPVPVPNPGPNPSPGEPKAGDVNNQQVRH